MLDQQEATMIDRITFQSKVLSRQDKFELDYDFADAENVFVGKIDNMTVRVFQSGKATVQYDGVVRRVTGDHGEVYQRLIKTKEDMMASAFGELTDLERD